VCRRLFEYVRNKFGYVPSDAKPLSPHSAVNTNMHKKKCGGME